jgi:hypothetical protein
VSEKRYKIIGELSSKTDFLKFRTQVFMMNFAKTHRPKGALKYLYARKGEFNTAQTPRDTQYVVTETELKTLPADFIIPTSRPFCKKMAKLRSEGKYFTEAQIRNFAKSDMMLKYNLNPFDNAGGFMREGQVIKPSCRHVWVAFVEV